MGAQKIEPNEVIEFWQNAGRNKWFSQDDSFGKSIHEKFFRLWQTALSGRLREWQKSDEGLLALALILDQFPRKMFQNDPRAFCSDHDALKIARIAVENDADKRIEKDLRGFFYMPFEHSEKLSDQEQSIELFKSFHNAIKLLDAKQSRMNKRFSMTMILIADGWLHHLNRDINKTANFLLHLKVLSSSPLKR